MRAVRVFFYPRFRPESGKSIKEFIRFRRKGVNVAGNLHLFCEKW